MTISPPLAPPPPLNHHQINTTAVADDGNSTTPTPTPWSFETNWTVSRGSLNTSVTFESPDFPIDSESTAPKPPLLLIPPSSSNFEPCEIKISFTQKHEIRQVYVRSTARVYEIYYAPALHSENEYLCTVRCSVASVEENLFLGTDVKEAVSVNLEGPDGILPKGNVVGENNNGTTEDDWVEVKLPAGRLDEGNSLPNQTSSNVRNYQDYYEATAEINDSEPCMSLTLRLLSLQSKGCVYIDEVYVFAEPIDPSDTENQSGNAQHSSGSTLMTMLVPTLLGLAKSRAAQLPDQGSKSTEKRERLEAKSGPAISTNPVDPKLLESSEAKAELSRSQVSAPTPDKDKLHDSTDGNASSYSQVERVLEQLVSRVSRIEDICLRFEENMLKPINSMEARLQRVEQQVETLAKNAQCPRSPSCPRAESNPSSLSNDTKDSQRCGVSETEKKGTGSNLTQAVSTHFLPSLVVIAPEFSCCDEEEEVNDVLVSTKNSSNEKPKKTVSIDDALAAALAGFSSSAIAEHPKDNDSLTAVPHESAEEEHLKCNQAAVGTTLGSNSNDEAYRFSESLKVTAPEFTGKENDEASEFSESLKVNAPEFIGKENDKVSKFSVSLKVTAPEFTGKENGDDYEVISPSYENERPVVTRESSAAVLESPGDSTSTSGDGVTEIPNNNFRSQGTFKVVGEEAMEPTANSSTPPAHKSDTSKSGAQLVEKMSNFDKADILKHFPSNASNTAHLASSLNPRDINDGSESTVDYETPILEVEFASSENSNLKCPLEALLSNADDPAVEGTDERGAIAREEKTSTINNLLVELDGDHVGGFVVGEEVQQDLPPVHQETFVSLI